MKKLAVLSIILTIIISNVAQTTIKQIKDRGYFPIETSGNQLQYTYKQEDGIFVGVDIEICDCYAYERRFKNFDIKILEETQSKKNKYQ